MKGYSVAVPFTGVVYLTVEAETEQDAIEFAMNADVTLEVEGNEVDTYEWEMHEHVTTGNVFYGVRNDISAEAIPTYEK